MDAAKLCLLDQSIIRQTFRLMAEQDPKQVLDFINQESDRLKIKKNSNLRIGKRGNYTFIHDDTNVPYVGWQAETEPIWLHPKHKRRRLNLEKQTWKVDVKLPNDIIGLIFTYLTPDEFLNCRSVSRRWKTFVEKSTFWKRIMASLRATVEANCVLKNEPIQVREWDGLPYWRQYIKYTLRGFKPAHNAKIFVIGGNFLRVLMNLNGPKKLCSVSKYYREKYFRVLKEVKNRRVNEFNDSRHST